MEDGAHPKMVLLPEGKGGAERTTRALYPFPPSGLITVVTYPSRPICHFCLKLHQASRQGQFAWSRPEHFQEGDDVTELGFQKAGEWGGSALQPSLELGEP